MEEELIRTEEDIEKKMVRDGRVVCPKCKDRIKNYLRAYSTVPTEWRMGVYRRHPGEEPAVTTDFHEITDGPNEYEFVCPHCGALLTKDYDIARQIVLTMDRLEGA